MSKPFPVPDPRLPELAAAVASQPRGLHAALDQYTETTSKFLRNVGYPVVILGLILLNFSVIQKIGGQLPEMVAHLQTLEIPGVKVAINNTERSPVAIPFAVPEAKRADVKDVIGKLGPDTFLRLFNVERGSVSCNFERPVPMMRKYVALDYELQDLKLVSIDDDDKVALDGARDSALENGPAGYADIGLPVSCYRMDLTDLGRDAKTTFVDHFSKAFDARVGLR